MMVCMWAELSMQTTELNFKWSIIGPGKCISIPGEALTNPRSYDKEIRSSIIEEGTNY